MKETGITDIFFDLDHTLYDFDRNSALTFGAVFSDLQLPRVDDFMKHFKPINDVYWKKYAVNEISHDTLRYGRLKDTFEKIEVNVTDEQIYHIADYFIENLTNYNHVFDETFEILDYLQPHYQLHIITNGPEKVQEKKLKNAKLTHYFKTVTNSEKSGVKKPHPVIFEHALQIAGTVPEKSIMIGDNIEADVLGALGAGMRAIYFNEFKTNHPYQFKEIYRLTDLKKYL